MIGVLFLDVDNFKQINDQFGHAAGDHVLTSIAEHLSAAVRPRDVVARFAGDEFVVLLNKLTCIDDAVEIAERIAADLTGAPARSLDGYDIPVSVSIGIATSLGSDESACELIRHADAAMYRAKESGRGKYELFDHLDDQLQGVSGRRR
jgi:diguanylate cyclase (GGDEF)-like protein